MRHRIAFTLVELLVVIAIIAVLLGILLPSLAGIKATARRTQCASRLGGIGKAFTAYISDYDAQLPNVEFSWDDDSVTRNTIQHYAWTRRKQGWCHLGCLWAHGLIDNPFHFYCPATENWQDDFKGTSGGQMPVKTLKGFVYWPMSKESYTDEAWKALRDKKDQAANENYRPGYPKTATFQAELLMTRAIAADYSFHEVKSYGGRGWAVNALFPDGHVVYQPQPLDNGLGMWHEYRQFPGDICKITSWSANATWTDPIEAKRNVPVKSPIVRFMYALEP
jgi:prepilin-type N-terminal cleavage/methylation domain-containing protein/prepilin-type processing-associated H-X9-DG protein